MQSMLSVLMPVHKVMAVQPATSCSYVLLYYDGRKQFVIVQQRADNLRKSRSPKAGDIISMYDSYL